MTYELRYTSAERTLQPGVKGFGPVVATRGLPPALLDKLVALSGYRHLFAGHDQQAALNPVNYAHLAFAGSKPLHILSRVADAGFDYSHRSNKLAHHVVLTDAECVPAGPAALLQSAGWMAAEFSGEPQWLEQGPSLPRVETVPGICRHWQQITGDAGWGGVLAQSIVAPGSKPIIVVYRPGCDVLPLFAEALALLSPAQRWQTTFSTYYTKLPPGIACQWRGMIADDPETKLALRLPNVQIIDLTHPLGQAPLSPWVEYARTGKAPRARARAAQPTATTVAASAKSATAASLPIGIAPLEQDDAPFTSGPALDLSKVPVAGPKESLSLHSEWKWIAGSIAALGAIVLATLVANGAFSSPRSTSKGNSVAAVLPAAVAQPQPASMPENIPPSAEAPLPTTPADAPQVAEKSEPAAIPPPKKEADQPPPATTEIASVVPVAVKVETKIENKTALIANARTEPETHDPLAFVKYAKVVDHGLELPPRGEQRTSLTSNPDDSSGAEQHVRLIDLPKVKPSDIKLALVNSAKATTRFALDPEVVQGDRLWKVLYQTGSPAGDDTVAEFRIANEQLQFRWLPTQGSIKAERLSAATLRITAHGTIETIALQKPVALHRGEVDWLASSSPALRSPPIRRTAQFVITLIDPAAGKFHVPPQVSVPVGGVGTLSIPVSPAHEHFIDVEITSEKDTDSKLTFTYTLRSPSDASAATLKPRPELRAETFEQVLRAAVRGVDLPAIKKWRLRYEVLPQNAAENQP